MNDACKHKAAAASINWLVGIIKNKTGADGVATRATLASMFQEMVDEHCNQCGIASDCTEMEQAAKELSGRSTSAHEPRPVAVSNHGALLIRRMSRRPRLGRPR